MSTHRTPTRAGQPNAFDGSVAALPAGATAISVGLSIINLGSLTMDAFTLVDAGN